MTQKLMKRKITLRQKKPQKKKLTCTSEKWKVQAALISEGIPLGVSLVEMNGMVERDPYSQLSFSKKGNNIFFIPTLVIEGRRMILLSTLMRTFDM